MNINEIQEYLKLLRPYIVLSTAAFFISALVGFISASLFPVVTVFLSEGFSALAGPLLDRESWEIFLIIFLNNSFKVFLSILLGVIFALYPVVLLVVNGYVLGVLFFSSLEAWDVFFLAVVPHGIIELPVVFVGTAVGMMIGALAYKNTFKGQNHPIKKSLIYGLKFFVFILLPLLLLAALIEATLTPFIVETYLSN